MPQQLSCSGMYKFVGWLDYQNYDYSNKKLYKISTLELINFHERVEEFPGMLI